MAKQKKIESEPFWSELVQTYFSFCRDNFNEDPSFDGSAPKDMKNIISSLRLRAEKSNIQWTADVAVLRWKKFLEFAVKDKWLSENFLLQNINRQKDKIFFKIQQVKRGQPTNVYESAIQDALNNFKPIGE